LAFGAFPYSTPRSADTGQGIEMYEVPDFDEALRRQRDAFRAEYRANPELAKYETALNDDALSAEDLDHE
jgi:hypothetical protein